LSKTFVIITAGGTGSRMHNTVPKQFLKLGKLPLLWYVIRQFHEALQPAQIIVTLPAGYQAYWAELCEAEGLALPHETLTGGQERFHSVKAALEAIRAEEGWVGIHDGVRPFVSTGLIQRVQRAAEASGAALPALPVQDSVRQRVNDQWVAQDRSLIQRVQTPQIFDLHRLKAAYQTAWQHNLTDDAMVWEKAGHSVSLVEGEEPNFKITHEWDFEMAEWLSQKLDYK